jgi:hypothetical protein
MILNSAPQAEAVMSNVGEIGEFRIRNSAKAFNILSSGLYANKIRAIVRELSCNAVDSHAAAGRADKPFEVHLPTALEPHFSIRDFGTGLNHDQVTNIYTTYFESTKTNSNEFIGALGLGSKSPFSYTDNFTVTAIKDGRKGIYTAFINDAGVPSIALMMEENTDEPAGVEVKFAVNDRNDFFKFQQEAYYVYRHFSLKPRVGGVSNFKFEDIEYGTKDIIPGVHSLANRNYNNKSRAIMGNIAYPIEVPNNALGELQKLLNCGLELHFNIGELDFQASREGLSYIPQTIESIRKKLELLKNALTDVLAKEADVISNKWERSIFLVKKASEPLWTNSVAEYVTKTGFKLYHTAGSYSRSFNFEIAVDTLKDDFNISIRGFNKYSHESTCRNENTVSRYVHIDTPDGRKQVMVNHWRIMVEPNVYFVKNDTKIGATERSKYHWKTTPMKGNTSTVFVLDAADKTKPAKFKEFLEFIENPPETSVFLASSLAVKPRAGGVGRNVSILKLAKRLRAGSYRDTNYYAWEATNFHSLDATKTYYYVPLKAFEMQSTKNPHTSAHTLLGELINSGIPELNVDMYGVRKADIDAIKMQKNWINIEDHITKVLSNIPQTVVDGLAKDSIDNEVFMQMGSKLATKLDVKNPIRQLIERFANVKKVKLNQAVVSMLCRVYTKDSAFDPSKDVDKVRKECDNMYARYPMLRYVTNYNRFHGDTSDVAEYINSIDKLKGI